MTDLSEARAGTAVGITAAVGDYIAILKPRVMSLVVFTGVVGLVLAPGHLNPVLAAVAILCIAVGAGAKQGSLSSFAPPGDHERAEADDEPGEHRH